ncbi:hypothetical protein AVEN_194007-1 [Araneus ventricosus]|uniref:Uncharacterized protein n=1 Tax=Araneus ventricosus TaxID=182803 RepID=A0A4Y2LAH9_ARAVE|nr:hypothetical protein AVEN_194004-1 [Araneus ventricosus]GBN11512.1 hypothetical protein AVEN_194007-1 [Araneus ventricosus]
MGLTGTVIIKSNSHQQFYRSAIKSTAPSGRGLYLTAKSGSVRCLRQYGRRAPKTAILPHGNKSNENVLPRRSRAPKQRLPYRTVGQRVIEKQ